jgi:DNA invertase Pin-like site-specific DNA recombinase
MLKVYGYIRTSSATQHDNDGFPRQTAAIRDYAAAHSMSVERIFADEGVTGTTEKRPALAEMLVSLEQNGVGVRTVLVEMMSRLARDLMVQEVIVADFKRSGVNLVSVLDGEDLLADDPTRTMVRRILGAVSQYEKEMLVYKLRVARERKKAKTGKCEGRKGYADLDPRLLEEIVARRRSRQSFVTIAGALNEDRSFETLSGQRFTPSGVRMILKRNSG